MHLALFLSRAKSRSLFRSFCGIFAFLEDDSFRSLFSFSVCRDNVTVGPFYFRAFHDDGSFVPFGAFLFLEDDSFRSLSSVSVVSMRLLFHVLP